MTSTTSKPSKAAALARVQALMAGTLKRFPSGNFTLRNTSFTTASLVALFKSLADAIAAVNDAQAKAKDAVAALRTTQAQVGPFVRAFQRFLVAAFANATQELADFGMTPPKARTPLTATQKAAAAEKLRATRKARGTKSRKERLSVKGDVTGIIVTPVTAPAAPSPAAAQPASPASSTPAPHGADGATKQ